MIFEYDTVILGSSLSAFSAALQKKSPVIFSDLRKPFRFDYLPSELDLSYFNLDQFERILTTPTGTRNLGVPAHLVWEHLLFLLSINGRAPLSNLCQSMRMGDNKIVCYNEYSKIAEVRFERCLYFGDDNVAGLGTNERLYTGDYTCYDWIAFNRGGKHEVDLIETEDNFVKEVWFYPSDRIDGNSAVKDACVVSVLNSEQLHNFDYSETTARFKLIYEMEKRGMKGLFNGYGPNGNPKYYKFKTTHLRRQKYPQRDSPLPQFKGFEKPEHETGLLRNIPQLCAPYDKLLRLANE